MYTLPIKVLVAAVCLFLFQTTEMHLAPETPFKSVCTLWESINCTVRKCHILTDIGAVLFQGILSFAMSSSHLLGCPQTSLLSCSRGFSPLLCHLPTCLVVHRHRCCPVPGDSLLCYVIFPPAWSSTDIAAVLFQGILSFAMSSSHLLGRPHSLFPLLCGHSVHRLSFNLATEVQPISIVL